MPHRPMTSLGWMRRHARIPASRSAGADACCVAHDCAGLAAPRARALSGGLLEAGSPLAPRRMAGPPRSRGPLGGPRIGVVRPWRRETLWRSHFSGMCEIDGSARDASPGHGCRRNLVYYPQCPTCGLQQSGHGGCFRITVATIVYCLIAMYSAC